MANGTRDELLEQLIAVVQELPREQIAEVSNYAKELRHQNDRGVPEPGSMAAIIEAMKAAGPLEFEEGELESLLAEIEAMRDLDMEEHG